MSHVTGRCLTHRLWDGAPLVSQPCEEGSEALREEYGSPAPGKERSKTKNGSQRCDCHPSPELHAGRPCPPSLPARSSEPFLST